MPGQNRPSKNRNATKYKRRVERNKRRERHGEWSTPSYGSSTIESKQDPGVYRPNIVVDTPVEAIGAELLTLIRQHQALEWSDILNGFLDPDGTPLMQRILVPTETDRLLHKYPSLEAARRDIHAAESHPSNEGRIETLATGFRCINGLNNSVKLVLETDRTDYQHSIEHAIYLIDQCSRLERVERFIRRNTGHVGRIVLAQSDAEMELALDELAYELNDLFSMLEDHERRIGLGKLLFAVRSQL